MGIALANLSILKTGKARAIRFSTLEALCQELGCRPGDLLEFQPEPGRAAINRPPSQPPKHKSSCIPPPPPFVFKLNSPIMAKSRASASTSCARPTSSSWWAWDS